MADRSSVHTRNSAVDTVPSNGNVDGARPTSTSPPVHQNFLENQYAASPSDSDEDEDYAVPISIRPSQRSRRLSMFESVDGLMDLESDRIGGSARQRMMLGRSL
jgi:hypothetical protein